MKHFFSGGDMSGRKAMRRYHGWPVPTRPLNLAMSQPGVLFEGVLSSRLWASNMNKTIVFLKRTVQ